MEVWQLVLVGGAIAVALFWDAACGRVVAAVKRWRQPAAPAAAGWAAAMDAIQVVRGRLVATGCLDDDAKAAIESIVQALVQGSDK